MAENLTFRPTTDETVTVNGRLDFEGWLNGEFNIVIDKTALAAMKETD